MAAAMKPLADAIVASTDSQKTQNQASHALTELLHNKITQNGLAGVSSNTKWNRALPTTKETMILRAMLSGPTDGLPIEPTTTLKSIMETSPKQCFSLLRSLWEGETNQSCHIPKGLAISLNCGDIYCHNSSSQSHFFSVWTVGRTPLETETKYTDMSSEAVEEALRLDTLNMPDSVIQKTAVIPTMVQYPPVEAEVTAQLKNFGTLISLTVGATSRLSQKYTEFIKLLEDGDLLARFRTSWTSNNPTLHLQLMHIINETVHMFFRSCERAKTIADIDFNSLNYIPGVALDIIRNKPIGTHIPAFVTNKITAIKQAKQDFAHKANRDRNKRNDTDTSKEEGSPERKKQRNKDKPRSTASPVSRPESEWAKHPNLPENCKVANFMSIRSKVATIPKISIDGTEVSICGKYHCIGTCIFGDACDRKKTHSPLLEADQARLATWVTANAQ
jgi:hypothetical protein